MFRQLKESVYSVGVMNPALRVFDIVMKAEYGTSYNAYLVKGSEAALIDTVHESFFDEYSENVNAICNITDIKYLIMNHTEPDHSGSINKLLEINPEIEIICSAAAQKYLSEIINKPFKCRVVKQGDTLDLGNKVLSFIPSPFLHWPDTIFTYDASEKTVFTCDFLGAHYCEPRVLDVHCQYPGKLEYAFRYYFEAILGPFRPYVLAGLDKLSALDFDMACPSHGPVLTTSIKDRMDKYRDWSTPKAARDKKLIAVCYASAYGYTRKLAEAAAEALTGANFEVKLLDIVETPLAEVIEAIADSDAVLIGSDTINRDATKPVWDVLTSIDAINTRKPAGAFGSFGWSGEAVPMIKNRLEGLKFKFISEGLRVNFRPNDNDLQNCKEYALSVANSINK